MARTFPTNDDYIGVPNNSAIQSLTAWTYSVWIFPLDGGPSASQQVVMIKEAGGNSARVFLAFYDDGHSTYHNALLAWADRNTDGWAFSVDDIAPFNQWLHVVTTYDGTDGPRIYTRTQGLFTEASYVTRTVGSSTWNSDSGGALLIGHQGNQTRNFPGRVAEAKLWNARMDLAEIQIIAGGDIPRPTNLVGYWPLIGEFAPEPDLSGKGGHGTVYNNSPPTNHAPVGRYAPMRINESQLVSGEGPAIVPARGWCR